jgi:two-component system response regulator GlrR
MPSGKILAIDDDRNLLEVLKMRLESADYEVATALNEADAIQTVKGEPFDLSIIDLKLVGKDGLSVMEELHLINPTMPIIILTGHGSIENAVEAMKKGAFSYITKPFEPQNLLLQIEKALENRRLTLEVERLKGLLEEKYSFTSIVAKSSNMQGLLQQVAQIAKTDSTVYIHGESGTGKELIARAVHLASDRKDKPFVVINCAAIPEALLESELFGHQKGAFTGAHRTSEGLLTKANKGTFFLDEIGDMPLSLQGKLLRALQERQFYPVGSREPVDVDLRVVVATNKDLEDEVKEKRFREDLFFRIHVIPIHLPPLRERREDIPHLVEHFLKKFNKQMNKKLKGLSPQAMQKPMLYEWPGNVRELENKIEYAVAVAQQDVISDDGVLLDTKGMAAETSQPLKEAKATFEKEYIIQLMELTGGNVSKASELAGKYRADFYNLLKKHSIISEDFRKNGVA